MLIRYAYRDRRATNEDYGEGPSARSATRPGGDGGHTLELRVAVRLRFARGLPRVPQGDRRRGVWTTVVRPATVRRATPGHVPGRGAAVGGLAPPLPAVPF